MKRPAHLPARFVVPALAAWLVLLLHSPVATVAQAAPGRAGRDICWRRPTPACKSVLLLEMGVAFPLLANSRAIEFADSTFGQNPPPPVTAGYRYVAWEGGFLLRAGERTAIGPVLQLGGGNGARSAIKARGRRYFSDRVSGEIAAGLLRGEAGRFTTESTGFTAQARLNLSDLVGVFVEYDDLAWGNAHPGSTLQYADGPRRARSLNAGLAAGSELAAIVTGVALLAYGLLAAIFASADF